MLTNLNMEKGSEKKPMTFVWSSAATFKAQSPDFVYSQIIHDAAAAAAARCSGAMTHTGSISAVMYAGRADDQRGDHELKLRIIANNAKMCVCFICTKSRRSKQAQWLIACGIVKWQNHACIIGKFAA